MLGLVHIGLIGIVWIIRVGLGFGFFFVFEGLVVFESVQDFVEMFSRFSCKENGVDCPIVCTREYLMVDVENIFSHDWNIFDLVTASTSVIEPCRGECWWNVPSELVLIVNASLSWKYRVVQSCKPSLSTTTASKSSDLQRTQDLEEIVFGRILTFDLEP